MVNMDLIGLFFVNICPSGRIHWRMIRTPYFVSFAGECMRVMLTREECSID
jgi:hypothetical protein